MNDDFILKIEEGAYYLGDSAVLTFGGGASNFNPVLQNKPQTQLKSAPARHFRVA
ncbi:MAG TPA: hypothetical protein VIN59_00455 [Alphaproteobacteria bacterium]